MTSEESEHLTVTFKTLCSLGLTIEKVKITHKISNLPFPNPTKVQTGNHKCAGGMGIADRAITSCKAYTTSNIITNSGQLRNHI